MSPDIRRAALVRNLELAEAGGYTYIIENNRRLIAELDAREAAPEVASSTAERARALRSLVWSWLPEEPARSSTLDTSKTDDLAEPTTDEQRERALALLEQVRDAQQFLASWTDRLIRIAAEHKATNPEIGERLGVGKERIRRRLLKEPDGKSVNA